MKKEQVLLINPNWRQVPHLGRFCKHLPRLCLEMGYIYSELKDKKIPVKFYDLWALDKTLLSINEEIKKASWIVIDTAPSYPFWRDGTTNVSFPIEYMKIIRKINPTAKIIAIGPHGTIKPELLFHSEADFIIKGEPELAVPALIKNKKMNVEGVCYKTNGEWKTADSYAIVRDLDDLPDMYYSEINIRHSPHPFPPKEEMVKSAVMYETSRGCPYNCIFCFRKGFRGLYREKGIKKIRRELTVLKKMGIEYVYFMDEMFAVNRKKAIEICMVLKELGLKWGCETRPEALDDELIGVFGESNCLNINFGLESGDVNILSNIGKRSIDLNKLRRNVTLLGFRDIWVHFFLIVGAPGETRQTLNNTLKYLSTLPMDKISASAGMMIPYPSTELWQMGIKEGKGIKEWENWEDFQGLVGNKFDRFSIQKEFLMFFIEIRRIMTRKKIRRALDKGKLPAFLKQIIAYGFESTAKISIRVIPKYAFRFNGVMAGARKIYYWAYRRSHIKKASQI